MVDGRGGEGRGEKVSFSAVGVGVGKAEKFPRKTD